MGMKRTQGIWFVGILKAPGGPHGEPPCSTRGTRLESLLDSYDPDIQSSCFLGRKGLVPAWAERQPLMRTSSPEVTTDDSCAEGEHITKEVISGEMKADTRTALSFDYHLIFWITDITFGAK